MSTIVSEEVNNSNIGEVTVENELSTPAARAARCLALREMMELSREAVRIRYGIARGTLQNWESARAGGLTKKGAAIIAKAAKAENIDTSVQWLMDGVGPEPMSRVSESLIDQSDNYRLIGTDEEMQAISTMLKSFRSHYPNPVDMVVQDDAMFPQFKIGEYVAGNRHYRDDIESTVGLFCIAQTVEFGQILRYVKLGDEIGYYHLISINPDSKMSQPTIYNAEVISTAPVIWRYRLPKINRNKRVFKKNTAFR